MERNPMQKLWDLLEDSSLEDVLELLPNILKELNSEEKINVLTDLLCEEWYTNEDHKFIQSVLEIYTKSIID